MSLPPEITGRGQAQQAPVMEAPAATSQAAALQAPEDNPNQAAPQPDAASPAGVQADGTSQGADEPASQQAGQNLLEAPTDPDDAPITDWASVDLGLAPDQVDAGLVAAFGEQAMALGLSAKQARELAQWQVRVAGEAGKQAYGEEVAALQKAWGRHFENNRKRVCGLVSRIERLPGMGNFSGELLRSGAARNATVVQGLLAMASMVEEVQQGRLGGQPGQRSETPLEGILDVARQSRGLGQSL